MRTKEPAAGFKVLAVSAMIAALGAGSAARAEGRFRLEKDSQGQVRPFKVRDLPLPEFVREYARFTGTPITLAEDPRGRVRLLLRKPLQPGELTEIFHRVLNDNGFAAVDAPAGNGWIVMKMRDARDAAIPTLGLSEVPDSARLVTAFRELKHADSELVARMMRSFMPAPSRIIPTPSQLLITDTGSNLRRLEQLISRMDTPEAARRQREQDSRPAPRRSCGEHRIEKLVVEKLEIQGQSNGMGDGSMGGRKK